jgi:hypothetical protein
VRKIRDGRCPAGRCQDGAAGPRAGEQRPDVPVVAARGDREGHRADRVDGEFRGHGVASVGQQERHHVPVSQVRLGEQGGDPAHFGVQRRVGEHSGVVHQRLAVRVFADLSGEQCVEVGVRAQARRHPGTSLGAGHQIREAHSGA